MKRFLKAVLLVTMLLSCAVAFAQDEKDYVDRRPVKEVMVIRGVIDEIKDGRVTIKGANAAEMNRVILTVEHRTHLLNGETGNKMDLKDFSKGMAVTAYFDSVMNDRDRNKSKNNSNPPTKKGIPHSNAYAMITGNDQKQPNIL